MFKNQTFHVGRRPTMMNSARRWTPVRGCTPPVQIATRARACCRERNHIPHSSPRCNPLNRPLICLTRELSDPIVVSPFQSSLPLCPWLPVVAGVVWQCKRQLHPQFDSSRKAQPKTKQYYWLDRRYYCGPTNHKSFGDSRHGSNGHRLGQCRGGGGMIAPSPPRQIGNEWWRLSSAGSPFGRRSRPYCE